jgi:heat shock protein HslJ
MRRVVTTIGVAAAVVLAGACAPRPVPGASMEIVDVEWVLTELDGRPVTPASERGAPTLTLAAAESRAHGFAGCNRFFATYERSGASLRFSAIGATRMACLEEGVMALEQAYLEALEATRRYEAAGGTLTLFDDAGPRARFRQGAAAAAP